MYCNMCIFIFPGTAITSTDNVCLLHNKEKFIDNKKNNYICNTVKINANTKYLYGRKEQDIHLAVSLSSNSF